MTRQVVTPSNLSDDFIAHTNAVTGESTIQLNTFGHYLTSYDTDGVEQLCTAPHAGEVYMYTKGDDVVYRFVPDDDATHKDAFYEFFSAGVCSGLIVARG